MTAQATDPTKSQTAPKQARAKKTYNNLLSAAQDILATDGFEALNSNAIVERAGVTPPAFYRYFVNKNAVLTVLCEQLMQAQNEVLTPLSDVNEITLDMIVEKTRENLYKTVEVTKSFKGGFELLVLLRVLPYLSPIRIKSHEFMANYIGTVHFPNADVDNVNDYVIRARLAIELGYTVVEMLLETNFKNLDIVIDRAAHATAAIFEDLF